jgi:hypothetical protein
LGSKDLLRAARPGCAVVSLMVGSVLVGFKNEGSPANEKRHFWGAVF